jgi:hypothetical protein
MIKVYDSLKQTVKRNKPSSIAIARINGSHGLILKDEMKEFEKLVVDRLGKWKMAVEEGEAAVAGEVQHAAQVAKNLTAKIAELEAKLREMEDTVRRKDLASQNMETSLTAKIHDLRSEVTKKDEILATRDNEANDLKSKIDVLAKRVTESEAAIQQAKAQTASQSERAKHVTESFRAKILAMEAQLSQTEATVRAKELTIKEQEQNLSAKIQDLENQVRTKEKLLTVKLVKEMSSLKQPEGVEAVETQDTGGQSKQQEKPGTSPINAPGFMSDTTNSAPQIVAPDFFKRTFHELTDFIGPFSSMIVRDHVKALGESMDNFPKARLRELFEMVRKEILNEEMKIEFGKWVARTCKSVE